MMRSYLNVMIRMGRISGTVTVRRGLLELQTRIHQFVQSRWQYLPMTLLPKVNPPVDRNHGLRHLVDQILWIAQTVMQGLNLELVLWISQMDSAIHRVTLTERIVLYIVLCGTLWIPEITHPYGTRQSYRLNSMQKIFKVNTMQSIFSKIITVDSEGEEVWGVCCEFNLCASSSPMKTRFGMSVVNLTHSGLVTPYGDNISSDNGLMPDGTKPLPEPMLTDHQWSPVTFTLGQFHKRCLNHQSLKSIWKSNITFHSNFPGTNELIYVLPQSLECCIEYHHIEPRYL